MNYVTVQDITELFRALTPAETTKARALIPIVEDSLRQEALNVGKDLDELVDSGKIMQNVLKSVIVDVIGRNLMTPTDGAPMSQISESALGYSVSGTYLVPGGGLFIKKSELARLGLRRQQIGAINLDTRNHCLFD